MSKKRLVKLFTDYEEAPDHYFSKPWEAPDFTFFRVSKRSKPEIGRRELFKYLEDRGIECVPHGSVNELSQKYDSAQLVVYTNEHEHGGKGKELMSMKDAVAQYPEFYASVFTGAAGECIRHFQYGIHGFEMPFISKNDWRSNCGTIRSWVRGISKYNLLESIGTPYFAIDFVPGTDLATDFQFAPGTKNDGLETFLSPRDMHKSITESIFLLHEKGILNGSQEGMWGAVEGNIPSRWERDDYFWLRFK